MSELSELATKWLTCYKPQDKPAIRLICFSHAGGSGTIYRTWQERFPRYIEVCPIEFPGRWSRIREPVHTDMDSLVEAIMEGIQPLFDTTYAIFGFSLGGLVAYDLVCQLEKHGMNLPCHLFIAQMLPPDIEPVPGDLHTKADQEFISGMAATYGGIPEEVLTNTELLELTLPIVRADMTIYESFLRANTTPVSVPLTLLAGDRDETLPIDLVKDWKRLARASFDYEIYPGGHFFIKECEQELINTVIQRLRSYL